MGHFLASAKTAGQERIAQKVNILQQTEIIFERGIYGFYSKTAPFIDFTLYFRFLQFYKVKYLNFYE